MAWHDEAAERLASVTTDGEGFLVVVEWTPARVKRPRPEQLAMLPAGDGYGTALLDC